MTSSIECIIPFAAFWFEPLSVNSEPAIVLPSLVSRIVLVFSAIVLMRMPFFKSLASSLTDATCCNKIYRSSSWSPKITFSYSSPRSPINEIKCQAIARFFVILGKEQKFCYFLYNISNNLEKSCVAMKKSRLKLVHDCLKVSELVTTNILKQYASTSTK